MLITSWFIHSWSINFFARLFLVQKGFYWFPYIVGSVVIGTSRALICTTRKVIHSPIELKNALTITGLNSLDQPILFEFVELVIDRATTEAGLDHKEIDPRPALPVGCSSMIGEMEQDQFSVGFKTPFCDCPN
jgi:hypothetical protein